MILGVMSTPAAAAAAARSRGQSSAPAYPRGAVCSVAPLVIAAQSQLNALQTISYLNNSLHGGLQHEAIDFRVT